MRPCTSVNFNSCFFGSLENVLSGILVPSKCLYAFCHNSCSNRYFKFMGCFMNQLNRTPLKQLLNAFNCYFIHSRPATSLQISNAACFYKSAILSLYGFCIKKVMFIIASKSLLNINGWFFPGNQNIHWTFFWIDAISNKNVLLTKFFLSESFLMEQCCTHMHKKKIKANLSKTTYIIIQIYNEYIYILLKCLQSPYF